jgi:transposase InsO family protein
MDFVTGLPRTTGQKDTIWMIVDRLTKSAHFIPINENDPLEKPSMIYMEEIVRLHGVPTSIVFDRDPRFTSRFWERMQKHYRTTLKFSTATHPQTDGQCERVIRILLSSLTITAISLL